MINVRDVHLSELKEKDYIMRSTNPGLGFDEDIFSRSKTSNFILTVHTLLLRRYWQYLANQVIVKIKKIKL